MSKVAIQGNASGTGTFTIAAPNSNTDRTLTLPDEAGTVLTSASTISGLGSLTQADVWRLTTNKSLASGTDEDITANLERADDATSGLIGSGMSESSGIFTFPETGIYLISVNASFARNSNGDRAALISATVSTDSGSNFDVVARGRSGIVDVSNTSDNYGQNSLFALVDVTNISTFRIKFFTFVTTSGCSLVGNTDRSETSFLFIRLGDT